MFTKTKRLCAPALLYLGLSIIGIICSIFQNFGNKNIYKLASYSIKVPNNIFIFIVKIIYVLFWTWILNLMCKDGHSGIAWFLILIPFILLFSIMALAVIGKKGKK
jgi:hypothetical protein